MRKFVFPITTGRSGSVFLTELLKRNWAGAEVHHERLGYTRLGLDSPDASHFTLFNSVGNVGRVREYWKRKMDLVLETKAPAYAEISHFLFKAGLVENMQPLLDEGEVHLVLLKRDPAKIQWSYVNRFEFTNNGYTWLFALDPGYPNTLVASKALAAYGAMGSALWYVYEVFTRMEYYAQILAQHPNVHIHRADLAKITNPVGAKKLLADLGVEQDEADFEMPPRLNESKVEFFGPDMKKKCAQLIKKAPLNSEKIAKKYVDAGRRLEWGGGAEPLDPKLW